MTLRNDPPRPLGTWLFGLTVAVLMLASFSALEWDLETLLDAEERSAAFRRLGEFLGSFGSPDLSAEYLGEATGIAMNTLATALLGTLLGIGLGYGLALGAARCIAVGSDEGPGRSGLRIARRIANEGCRLALDVLRGVPDFVWAIVILTGPGPGAVTGILAIALNVAGILGKIYSELWDAVPERSYEAVRATGSGRLATFFFGIQPRTARSMLSFTLMRTECAIRNASVIGVVSRGGLGAALFDEFNFGNYDRVVTLLMFTILLTASADALSNVLRYQLRSDPNHPRTARGTGFRETMTRRGFGLLGAGGLVVFSAVWLREGFAKAAEQMQRIEWEWIRGQFGQFLMPDLAPATLLEAARECVFPLAIGFLGTIFGVALAALLAYPASMAFQVEPDRFSGERTPTWLRSLRIAILTVTRGTALVFRAVPEVAWILILASFFRLGVVAGLLALVLHTAGVLARVFTEAVDNVPYRQHERVFSGSRFATFVYSALPAARTDWSAYSFLQLESSVRAGVVLGVIGIGGIGNSFHTSFQHFSYHRAGTFLLAMIVLTVIVDRLSRIRSRRLAA